MYHSATQKQQSFVSILYCFRCTKNKPIALLPHDLITIFSPHGTNLNVSTAQVIWIQFLLGSGNTRSQARYLLQMNKQNNWWKGRWWHQYAISAPGNSSTFQLQQHLQPHFELIFCAQQNQGWLVTGYWMGLWHGSTYFKPLEQILGWARTAMFVHFWNNHQNSALLVLRLGWIWVLATGSQNMIQLPCIGWDESLAKLLPLGSCAIYFDKKECCNWLMEQKSG